MALMIAISFFMVIFGCVHLSPVVTRTIIEPGRNELKDLFYISAQEEQVLEENSADNAMVEKVKARILKGLNLKEPPKTFQPIPPLLHFIPENNSWSGLLKNNTAPKASSGASEFFLSELVPNTCFDQKIFRCIRFHIDLKDLKNDGKIAELWLYKREGIRQFTITQFNADSTIKEQFNVSNLSKLAKWIRLDTTVLLNSNFLDLEVSSLALPIDTGKDKNPVLIVKDSLPERSKRSPSSCEEGSNHCCVKDWHVSFKEFGWDSWIIEPSGYKANFCKGSCENRVDMAENNHSSILIMMSKGKKKEAEKIVHCSSKAYKALPIIYIAESGLKIITNLPDMTVTDCGCR